MPNSNKNKTEKVDFTSISDLDNEISNINNFKGDLSRRDPSLKLYDDKKDLVKECDESIRKLGAIKNNIKLGKKKLTPETLKKILNTELQLEENILLLKSQDRNTANACQKRFDEVYSQLEDFAIAEFGAREYAKLAIKHINSISKEIAKEGSIEASITSNLNKIDKINNKIDNGELEAAKGNEQINKLSHKIIKLNTLLNHKDRAYHLVHDNFQAINIGNSVKNDAKKDLHKLEESMGKLEKLSQKKDKLSGEQIKKAQETADKIHRLDDKLDKHIESQKGFACGALKNSVDTIKKEFSFLCKDLGLANTTKLKDTGRVNSLERERSNSNSTQSLNRNNSI